MGTLRSALGSACGCKVDRAARYRGQQLSDYSKRGTTGKTPFAIRSNHHSDQCARLAQYRSPIRYGETYDSPQYIFFPSLLSNGFEVASRAPVALAVCCDQPRPQPFQAPRINLHPSTGGLPSYVSYSHACQLRIRAVFASLLPSISCGAASNWNFYLP